MHAAEMPAGVEDGSGGGVSLTVMPKAALRKRSRVCVDEEESADDQASRSKRRKTVSFIPQECEEIGQVRTCWGFPINFYFNVRRT